MLVVASELRVCAFQRWVSVGLGLFDARSILALASLNLITRLGFPFVAVGPKKEPGSRCRDSRSRAVRNLPISVRLLRLVVLRRVLRFCTVSVLLLDILAESLYVLAILEDCDGQMRELSGTNGLRSWLS